MSTVGDDPGDYMNNLPNVYDLNVRGRSTVSRADWELPFGRTLPYGTTLNLGWIGCVSRSPG
jgi:hypothetical protein